MSLYHYHQKHHDKPGSHQGLLKSYVTGFVLSVVLTLCAYVLIMYHLSSSHTIPPHETVIPIILILAFVQLIVQLVFFLHMTRETKPRWNLFFFFCFIGIIFLVVVGSLWIMHHLNYNMTPIEMNDFLLKDEGIKR